MNLIDTHCHLDFPEFDKDRRDAIDRAASGGIVRIINVSSSLEGCRKTLALTEKYELIYGTVGIHPHYADSAGEDSLGSLKKLAANKKIVAIGETGLDYYRNISSRENQERLFLRSIALANDLDLPLVVHSRNATKDVSRILRQHVKTGRRGVFHCFSGTAREMDEILDMGFYISFTCNLTFKNGGPLRELAGRLPVDRLLIETDAPFLAPQQFRGRRNEPAYISYLLEAISDIKGLSRESIAEVTTGNANKFFKLGI